MKTLRLWYKRDHYLLKKRKEINIIKMVAFEKSLPKKPKLFPFLSFPRFIAAQRGRPSSHAGETCNVVGLVRLVRLFVAQRGLERPRYVYESSYHV